MTRSQWCLGFSRITFLLLGVVIAMNAVIAGELTDYKCTYASFPPPCMCQEGNPVPTDRCAAAVPPEGEPSAYNTECGPMFASTCQEGPNDPSTPCGNSNPCGNIHNCIGHDCDEWIIGTEAICIEFLPAQKPPCTGTWGHCDKNLVKPNE